MNSGIDLSHVKPDLRPQDDLFRHVNGSWLETVEIPPDKAGDGGFYDLYNQAELQVQQIIEELAATSHPVGSISQKIGDLYKCFMDAATIEEIGITPIAADIERALAISDATEWHQLLGEFEAKGSGGLFYEYIASDKKASDTNITHIGQSGISLPDEAYYREDEYLPIREAFLVHVERMFTLAGISDASSHAARILELETEIASHHWDQVRDQDEIATYNKFTFAELTSLTSGFDWQTWLNASGTPPHILENVIVRQPSFFTGIATMLADFHTAKWSSWLAWNLLSGSAPYLSSPFVNQNFAFYGTTLSGIPMLRERWKRGVGLVEGSLGEAVGQIYVERHFPPLAKERMTELVANLLEAYRIGFSEIEWMSPTTKAAAQAKLNKFTPKIGYPDKWRDYSKLTITADDLFGNLQRITTFNQEHEFSKIGKPVDRLEWMMTPQTVNAYYYSALNEIVFPAAILQPPFFHLDGDSAANYGGIGAIIGHEIGHGFDDQGSKSDGDGNLNDWWTSEDRAKFEELSAILIAQYDLLSPEQTPDVHVNGALTIGENIGDLGGLIIAIKAYEISLKGEPAPVIDGLTGIQRLFFGWAQSWRTKMRSEEIRRRIATDPHSPDEFRCNQVARNLNEFYSAFDITESDAMYLPEEERVRIW